MKKAELRASFERIKPREADKKRMLDNILKEYEKKRRVFMPFNFRKAIPALALVIVITGGILTCIKFIGKNSNNQPNGYYETGYGDNAREDAAVQIINQFQIGDRHYILLDDELREDYGLPAVIDEKDIGERIADIETSPDASLTGSKVYRYIPAGGEAVVAVKRGNEYKLFRFFAFESYINNQDEDATEYLKIYGINRADDIAKIQFIDYTEQSKLEGYTNVIAEITDSDELAGFYGYFSLLKNSSDKYFDTLFNFNGSNSGKNINNPEIPEMTEPDTTVPEQSGYGKEMPQDIPTAQAEFADDLPLSGGPTSAGSGMTDMGNTGSGSSEPGYGFSGDALANPVTIRIYNKNGVYYDTVYYRNIGFISRYEISEDFEKFIAGYLDK